MDKKKLAEALNEAVEPLDEATGHRLAVLTKQADKNVEALAKSLKHLSPALRRASGGKELSRNDAKQLWNFVTAVAAILEKTDDSLSKLVIKLNEYI